MANLGRENENLEFKESVAETEKALRAICAMLNKSGKGTVIFGVKDNGDVIGTLVGANTLSTLSDRIKEAIKPTIYPFISDEEIDGKKVIRVSFVGNNKPYACRGAVYTRVDDQNLPFDPINLKDMVKESEDYYITWENTETEYGIEKVSIVDVEKYYSQAVALNRVTPFSHTTEELLTHLKLMKKGKLTNAGYLLFGNDGPITYKAVEYATTARINPIDLKRFEGNIFNLIDTVINYISAKIRWKVEISGIRRDEIPEIPIVAIREIVINSLSHCEYNADSDQQITIDPDVVEIYNPGCFPSNLSPEDYINNHVASRSRHKTILGILYKAFDIETLGRGFARMNEYCKESNVKWDYKMFEFGFLFRFYRKQVYKRMVPTINVENQLSKNATILIQYMETHDIHSISEVCSLLNKKDRTCYMVLKELLDSKQIQRIGSDREGYWHKI